MPKVKPPVINGIQFLTLQEAASLLGYTTRWLYELVYSKRIRATKRGNCWLINPAEIKRFQADLFLNLENNDEPADVPKFTHTKRLSDDI